MNTKIKKWNYSWFRLRIIELYIYGIHLFMLNSSNIQFFYMVKWVENERSISPLQKLALSMSKPQGKEIFVTFRNCQRRNEAFC